MALSIYPAYFIRCLLLIAMLQFANNTSIAQFRADVLLESAKREIQQNNFVNAIKKLNLCIATEPTNVEAYYFRAACKYSLFDDNGAEQDFTAAVTKYSPYFYEAYHHRSQVRYRLGNYTGALADINKVIEKQSKNPKLLIERAFIRLATKDFINTIADCNKALESNIVSIDVYLCKAAAEDALADYDNALCDYDQAIKINPRNEDAYVRRGITKFNMENYYGATEDYNTSISLDSTCTFAYYNRAEAKIKLNDTKSALQDYFTVLFYEPGNAYAYFNRAVLYSNMQKYKKAIDDFDKVLQINPDNIQALFYRAKLLQNTKDLKGAINDYNKIIELYPYFMEAYYYRAQIKFSMKDVIGANQDIDTGKIMSEVFHAKNNSQLSRDSTLITNLLQLNADFNQTPESEIDTLHIQFQPFIYIAKKDNNENFNCINSILLNKINQKENVKYCFTNTELISNDTSFNQIQSTNSEFEKVVQQTNNFYINDAMELIGKIIENDSLNAIAYFQRGIITCREVELLSKFIERKSGSNSSFDTEKSKIEDKWLAALNDFTKAMQLQPSFAVAYFNRANIKCLLRDFDGGLKDYETAIRINADFAEAHFNSGYVMYYLNQKQIACKEFSKAGELGIPESYSFIKKYCLALSK